MYVIWLPVDEYLGDFRVLAIVSNASMNMDGQTSPEVSIFVSFGYFPQSGTAGSLGSSILHFLGPLHPFPYWAHSFTFLPAVQKGSFFLSSW